MSASSGAVTATQLYSPYGSVRYSSGTLPTSYGYTGQRADANFALALCSLSPQPQEPGKQSTLPSAPR